MGKYYVLEIAFNESNYDRILNELYINGITSIIEENGVIKIYLPPQQSELLKSIKVNLTSNNTVKDHCIYISPFNDKDWNKEWESSIEPIYIKDKIVIYPSWKKDEVKDRTEKILIEIDPKMSFGTGHNETTQLILEMMCDYIIEDDKYMLDFGCGTGILSIAAIKLGLKKAVALDIDDDAINNALENFRINKVDKQISLYKSDISEIDEHGFDVICANITSGVILEKLSLIRNKLRAGGKLFVTGILRDEKEELKNALITYKFKINKIHDKAEWSAFYCIKF